MSIFNVLSLACGLALFLYGMEVMGDSLKKSVGSGLKLMLEKMTSSPIKGFFLGFAVTAIIQSSSATTVMVVGFVNSGTLTLTQAVGVIMGANVGTTVTAWLTGLAGLDSGVSSSMSWMEWLKPDAWMPILAVIGICLLMFTKRGRKKDIGCILLGFAVLMTGMDIMSGAVSGLKDDPSFASILTMFENPLFGVLAGAVLTAIIQSSSASVGILQSLATTGQISYGIAIPIIMGQNIGTCITAILSSIGANKNGKRAAFIQLYFNVIGTFILLIPFVIAKAFFNMPVMDEAINMWGIAGVHTAFNILVAVILGPAHKLLEKLAIVTIKDKKNENEKTSLLDERLFGTPSIAANRAGIVACSMAEMSGNALKKSLLLFVEGYDSKIADEVRELETKADLYEDAIGSYLVKLSAYDLAESDSIQVTKLLHIIGDCERISDHAVNIVESAEEMKSKKLEFSSEASRELSVMIRAVTDIVDMTCRAFLQNDLKLAESIEPLEEVVDEIKDRIKHGHIKRLQNSECSIEHGFVLSDMLNNLERVSDHCSNIAGCIIEISKFDALDMHKYMDSVKHDNGEFTKKVAEYREIYALD